jgi:uncharacterized membrane protein
MMAGFSCPRTLVKTATYCAMHFTVAILVAYALTRNWAIALAVGVVEPLVQTGCFAVHEKLWSNAPARLRFGGAVTASDLQTDEDCGAEPVGAEQWRAA